MATRRVTRINGSPYAQVRHRVGRDGGWFVETATDDRYGPYPDETRAEAALELIAYDIWRQMCANGECPPDIPQQPHLVYTHQFKGYVDWLGWQEEE